MLTVLDYLLKFLGAGIFSFVLWKKLKEDYGHDLIFSFTILVLALAAFGDILSQNFLPGFSFWSVLLFQLICVSFFVKKGYFKFYELIDGFTISWLTLFLTVNVSELLVQIIRERGLRTPDLYFLLHALFILLTFIVYKAVLKRYRGFSLYPSGKIGFLGLAVSSLYFLFRGLVAILTHSVLPFFGIQGLPGWNVSRITDAALSVLLFSAFAFWIYTRSGRVRANKMAAELAEFSEVVKKIFIWK